MRQADKEKTRWSQVTHYFFDDCAYYTPTTSDPFYGRIDFRQLTNIVTGAIVPQQYSGYAIAPHFVEMMGSFDEELKQDFNPKLYLEANP